MGCKVFTGEKKFVGIWKEWITAIIQPLCSTKLTQNSVLVLFQDGQPKREASVSYVRSGNEK